MVSLQERPMRIARRTNGEESNVQMQIRKCFPCPGVGAFQCRNLFVASERIIETGPCTLAPEVPTDPHQVLRFWYLQAVAIARTNRNPCSVLTEHTLELIHRHRYSMFGNPRTAPRFPKHFV